jgi:hypothetical protein
MVLLLELLLFIFGLVLVSCGKLPVSSRRAVEGVPARMLGVLAMLPLVLMFGIGVVYGFILARRGGDPKAVQDKMAVIAVFELVFSLIVVALIVGIAVMAAKDPEAARRRKRKKRRREEDEEYDDEYEDVRRRKRSRQYDEDEDEPRGRYR